MPARKPRLRRKVLWALGVLGVAVAAYAFDRSGPVETIPARVVDLEVYPHTPRGGETHTHTDAVLEYEGVRHTLEDAETLARGEWVEVRIRRGRISGRAHWEGFVGVANRGLLETEAGTPEPWEYDIVEDRHWDPTHNHWHPGPPPAGPR